MSLNITVNGKFRTCNKPSILDDPVRVKKQLECELRKQRLLEVREESKNIARKIRNDVAAEKERQLRNLEAIKAQELECWRQHVLDQKNNEYRQAIFQIGTAHNAAKLENEAMAQRKAAQEQFKKKTNERLGVKPPKVAGAKKTLQTAGTQTPNVLLKDKKKKTPKKRKRKNCPKQHTSTCHCSSAESETASEEESSDEVQPVGGRNIGGQQTKQKRQSQQQKSPQKSYEQYKRQSQQQKKQQKSYQQQKQNDEEAEDYQENSEESYKSPATKSVGFCPCPKVMKCPCTTDSSTSSLSQLSSTCTDEEEPPEVPSCPENTNNAGLSKNPPVIIDIDVDSNDSVTVTRGEIKDRYAQSNRQFSHVVRDSSPDKPRRSSLKGSITNKNKAAPNNPAMSKVQNPRFTQVSQLINGRSSTSVSKTSPHAPPPSLAVTTATSTGNSPRKSSTSGQISPRKSSTSGPTSGGGGFQITMSRGTVTLGGSDKEKGAPENVQCYDYNNKYQRNYPHPVEGLVHEPTVRERNAPNALEQAGIERELEVEREREKERRRERSEERGRKALEREQVRRECLQLTEKLDALTDQYPQLLNPPNISLYGHQLQAARTEKKRNAAVEELLLRPAIITCPEITEQQMRTTNQQQQQRSTCTANVNDAVNLGAPRAATDQINLTGSTDSCGTILLGYVDDQKQKIRNDLHDQPELNTQKAERLKNLLERIEELRKALCEELTKSGNSESMEQVIDGVSDVRRERERLLNEGEGRISPLAKHLHDVERKEAVLEQKLRELCKMRKPEAGRDAVGKRIGGTIVKKSGGNECRVQTSGNKPLEIIIKLKNDGGRRSRSKAKKSTKSPRKLSTLIDTPTRRIGAKRSDSNMRGRSQQSKQTVAANAQGGLNRQNSYDSNSTAYRSLPPRIGNEVDAIVDRLEIDDDDNDVSAAEEDERDENVRTEQNAIDDNYNDIPTSAGATRRPDAHHAKTTQRTTRLNPLIAHYVQRLLGMSRNSIRALGVSSSDIETPSSSIMNISTNRTGTTLDEAASQERIQRVQKFIEENRSFISDLEDSLRTHSDVTLETSIRMFEEIWQQRLRVGKRTKNVEEPLREKQVSKRKDAQVLPLQKQAQRAVEQRERETVKGGARKRLEQERSADANIQRENRVDAPTRSDKRSSEQRSSAAKAHKQQQEQQQQRPMREQRTESVNEAAQPRQQRATEEQRPQPATQAQQQQRLSASQNMQQRQSADAQQSTRESQRKRDISVATEERRAEEQIARYEQLTENCTQRIAELTELIQKVRTEKKRLMEITLSSVSEGRNSTEYIELPDGTRRRRSSASISSSGSSGRMTTEHQDALKSQPTISSTYNKAPQRGAPQTLDQQAAATSGEGLSTLDMNDMNVPLEKHKPTGISRDSGISISHPLAAAQDTEPRSQASTITHPSSNGAAARKHRPPPTMQRYSPNFAEDDVVHELSTIIEVDTPGTSRVNATTAGPAAAAAVGAESVRHRRLQPQPFPTFEEYAREMNMDVTQLDEDTSMRVHQEFDTLIANLRAAQGGAEVPDYREFPSLSAYLRNLSAQQEGAEKCQSPETIDDLISCLRIANLSIKAFPTRQEYLRQMAANSPSNGELIDSASLENITDTRTNTNTNTTSTESVSIDIEEELRKRQILQKSFRVAKSKEQIFSSTTRDGAEHERGFVRTFTAESGIEKLTSTTSDNASSEFDRQLFSLGMKWPSAMRARAKEADAVGRSQTSSSPERALHADSSSSPRKSGRDVLAKSLQQSPKAKVSGVSPKRAQVVSSTTKEVQFVEKVRSPSQSPARQGGDRQQQRREGSPRRNVSPGNAARGDGSLRSPARDAPTAQDASRHSRSSRRSPQRSSDCEFLSDFGRPLNLRDFLTKELLKHCSSSSSSTPTDDSLRSAFLQSIIDTMTPRTNTHNGGGSNQLDRQKTSTPVTHSAPSQSGGVSGGSGSGSGSGVGGDGANRSGSGGNTPSQLFSGESCLSSVRFYERSITRTYPCKTSAGGGDKTLTDNKEAQKKAKGN